MALDAQILLSILAHESSSEDISRTLRVTPASYSMSLADGTGANQAQVVWSDSRAIAAAGSSTIELKLAVDDRGGVAFSAIKLIYIRNTGSGQLEWSGGTWGDAPIADVSASPVFIHAGGALIFAAPTAAGHAVPGGEQTIVLSSTAGTTYDIILIGEGTVT